MESSQNISKSIEEPPMEVENGKFDDFKLQNNHASRSGV